MIKRLLVILVLAIASAGYAQLDLASHSVPASAKPNAAGVVEVPYIFWGADICTFYANGGLETKPGTIFKKAGLNIKLVAGDDFSAQLKRYMSGTSPFLRGTLHQIMMAAEIINSRPETKGRAVLQQSWSNGDHFVVRDRIETLNDLVGKKIAMQRNGPWIGFLDDMLVAANLKWSDVEIEWVDNITGPGSAGEAFRNNPAIHACFAVTPDMFGLTGGLNQKGTGAEGTVAGARVLASTTEFARSTPDIYVCREDFYNENKQWVTKFVAGFLKAQEETIALSKKWANKDDKAGSPVFLSLLQMAQQIYGPAALPTIDQDAYGLFIDAKAAGQPGNLAFFEEENNPAGFRALADRSLALAKQQGWLPKTAQGILPCDINWTGPEFIGYLATATAKAERKQRFDSKAVQAEIESFEDFGDRAILSETINFEPNELDFSVEKYGEAYKKLVDNAAKMTGAVIVVRGHADPKKTLNEMVLAGMGKGIVKQQGSRGNYTYVIQGGGKLNLDTTDTVIKLIEAGKFDGDPTHDPRSTMLAAKNLSLNRAQAVKKSILQYAKDNNLIMDESQVTVQGVGISEPLIPNPKSFEEAKENMRVEFLIVRVSSEVTKPSDFDF